MTIPEKKSSVITVVDYGSGNIGSILNMIRKVGGAAIATSDPDLLRQSKKLILPGVGSFDNAASKLRDLGLIQPIQECAQSGTPLLGICLGMHLLSDGSEEGELPGLGLIPGRVKKFQFPKNSSLKIPHMGWNRVTVSKTHPIAIQQDEDSKFYFVHSYHYQCEDVSDELFKTYYGYEFASGVQRENVIGVQFHPEKSHRYGMEIFRKFIDL